MCAASSPPNYADVRTPDGDSPFTIRKGIIKTVGKLGMANFPESSFKVIAVNMPMLFSGCFALVSPLLSVQISLPPSLPPPPLVISLSLPISLSLSLSVTYTCAHSCGMLCMAWMRHSCGMLCMAWMRHSCVMLCMTRMRTSQSCTDPRKGLGCVIAVDQSNVGRVR